jgi:trk system potassium uptake protein TrkA
METAINPRAITVSSVLGHVRRGRILRVHAIADGIGEVIEAEAMDTSPLVGQKIRDLDLPDGIRFGSIFREGEVIMPRGDTEIFAGDHIVLFALADAVDELSSLFRVSIEYI